jgi:hypothetical protein
VLVIVFLLSSTYLYNSLNLLITAFISDLLGFVSVSVLSTKEELKNKSDQVEGYILVALLFIPSSTTNDVPCSVC